MNTGIDIIAAERQRQIEKEGWTKEHDDEHKKGELAEAAACYAMSKNSRDFLKDATNDYLEELGWDGSNSPVLWPWDYEWWKEEPEDRIKELAKAGALIAAEIDRLLRIKELEDNLEEE